MDEPKYLGKTVLDTEDVELDIVRLDRPGRRTVKFETHELQAICPVTGQPDIYSCKIEFHADHTIESKSLKMWLVLLRDRGIFAEDLPVLIANGIGEAFKAHDLDVWVTCEVTQNVRGGIVTTCIFTFEPDQAF